MEFRTLRAEEREAWFDHCAEVFKDTGRAYFVRHYEKDPLTEDGDIFVAMDGQDIAATVRVFKRRVYLRGQAVGMGGIGEVSTKERYRRQGLSGELLKMAIAHMEALDLPISTLYTGTHHHYARYGWEKHPTEWVEMALPETSLPDGWQLRAAQDADWEAFPALYDLYMPRFNGAILRDDRRYWERWVRSEVKGAAVLIRKADGAVRAYGFTGEAKEGKPFRLQEFAAAPEAEALLPAMAAELAREHGAERIVLPSPLWSGQGERTPDDGLMVRLNHSFLLAGETIETTEGLRAVFERPWPISADSF